MEPSRRVSEGQLGGKYLAPQICRAPSNYDTDDAQRVAKSVMGEISRLVALQHAPSVALRNPCEICVDHTAVGVGPGLGEAGIDLAVGVASSGISVPFELQLLPRVIALTVTRS